MTATGRLDIFRSWPPGIAAMMGLERAIAICDLERSLVELVETRSSQLSGCGFCLDRHWKAAASSGLSAEKLADLECWQCSDHFGARERAALALTEALVDPRSGVGDRLLARARRHFTGEELSQLVYVIATINAWNRLAIADATPLGPGRDAGRSSAGEGGTGPDRRSPRTD